MSKLLRSIAIVAGFASLISLAWLLDFKLGFAPGNSGRLALTLPCIPSVSRHLDGGIYLFNIKNLLLYPFIGLLIFWRVLLLKKFWKLNS